jgi:hypothetical protein
MRVTSCPLCREWHSVDYRLRCYEKQAQRIRELEENISWLIKEVNRLKVKTKKLKEKSDEEEE